MSIIVRRGLEADRPSVVFRDGEIVWVQDTKQLYVGDGVTPGGINVQSGLHNHDDRYYTETEVDTFLAAKADVTALNAHINDQTVHFVINDNNTAPNEAWSSLKIFTELSGKSDIGHNHDNLYYRKAEVDALLSDEYVKVDVDDVAAGHLVNKLAGRRGINFYKVNNGVDNIYLGDTDVYLSQINGLTVPVFDEPTRLKTLSVEMITPIWMESRLSTNDWLEVGTARDALTGYVLPLNATIVGIMAHCENTLGNTGQIALYVNGAQSGVIHTISAPVEYLGYDMNLNIDLLQGDKIRLRNVGGTINDTLIMLYIRWRA